MKQIIGVAFLAMALCFGNHANAEGKAAERKTFVIGVEDFDYYPLHSMSRGSEFTGFARDVLDAFAHEHGYTFVYQPLPINRLFAVFFEKNTLDFKYPDNPHWQTERRQGVRLSYSTPLVVSEEGALVLPSHKGRSLLHIKTMGTMLGFTPWPYLSFINDKSVTLVIDDNFDSLLRQAIGGHIDVVYMNVDVAKYRLETQLKEPQGLVFDLDLPHAASDFSLSTRQHHEIIRQLNLFLQRQPLLLPRLREKYHIQGSDRR
ncbi:substrate-binding periplasmic protein [Undibacterium sp. JH2W]|uniref:substrate-binding periplasmic protein n=1 Tax=Undibacterium sp. JH2W TaxID=3413037 RepID=UPI003BF33F89